MAKKKKIHQQFGYPTSEINSAIDGNGEVSDCREICMMYRKTPSRRIVSANMAKEFNKLMAIELKEYKIEDICFLHMVEMATWFSNSCVIKCKEMKITEKLMETWLGTSLEAPVTIFCDIGKECANIFLKMRENINIQVLHTAAYSPFINGLCVAKITIEQSKLSLKVT